MDFSLIEIITTVGTFLFGAGGGGGLLYYLLEKDCQNHNQEMDISDKFESRLNKVENKLDETEKQLDSLKERNNKLVFQINVLVNRIELLVNRLDSYNELTEKEKEKLTSLPEYNTPNSNES